MGLNQENLQVHEDSVKRVQGKEPEDEYLYELGDLVKVFSHRTPLTNRCDFRKNKIVLSYFNIKGDEKQAII